jgi:hypothetical protein
MLDTLISSKTRINLLLKFFLNPECTAYLRELAEEYNESTNGIRIELNKFEQAGMISATVEKNRKLFKANRNYPFYNEIRGILMKYTGIGHVIEQLVQNLGKLEKVYLSGEYAAGRESGVIDVVLVGEINKSYLIVMIEKAQKIVNKKIRYLVYTANEFDCEKMAKGMLLLYDAKK